MRLTSNEILSLRLRSPAYTESIKTTLYTRAGGAVPPPHLFRLIQLLSSSSSNISTQSVRRGVQASSSSYLRNVTLGRTYYRSRGLPEAYQTLPDPTRPYQTLPDPTTAYQRPTRGLPDPTRPYRTLPEPSAPEEPDVPAFSGIPSASLGSGTYTCPPASRNTHVSDTLEPRCVAKASPRGRQSDQDGLTGLRVDRHGELRQSAGMRHAGWHLHLHDHAPFHVWGKPHLMSKEPAQQLVSTSGVEISAAQTAMPP